MTRVNQVKIIGLVLLIVLMLSSVFLCAIPQKVAFADSTENVLFTQTITSFPCEVNDRFVVGRGHDDDYIYHDFVYVYFGSKTLSGYDYEYYFPSGGSENRVDLILTDSYFKVEGSQNPSYMYVTTESEDYWTIKEILVVHYQPEKYTVTFDSNGGSPVASREVLPNMIVTSLPTPTRAGHTFLGWYIDGIEEYQYTDQMVWKDLTLVALWEVHKVKVTFYVDGETYYETTVDYGSVLWRADE